MRRTSSACAIALVTCMSLALGATAALADNLEADGDTASTTTTDAVFGSVCVGSTNTKAGALVIKRVGSGQVYANGATVNFSRTGALSGGLSSPSGALGSITLPSDWEDAANNTLSSSFATSVTYQPTAAGSASGTLSFSATGPKAGGGTQSRSASYTASGSASTCDTTPPVITPTVTGTSGVAGWYVSDVQVSWSVTDGQSAIGSSSGCGATTVAADTSGTTFTCTATSGGGTSSQSVTVKRDATPPTSVSATADRDPDHNGWFTAPFTASWTGSDAMSGIASCTETAYSAPDTAVGSLSGTCTDLAGNQSAPASFGFKYDATAPAVIGTPDRGPDHDDWYNAPVSIAWSLAPGEATDGASCDDPTLYDGADGDAITIGGSCVDAAGNEGTGSFGAFKYDATAPTASIGLDRPADHNGWYNAPVLGTTTGVDGTSGIASCTDPESYAGPDGSNVSLTGTCTDQAGNISGDATVVFDYDATAPTASIGLDRPADHNGWYNAPVLGTTTGVDGTSGIASCTDPESYAGPDGSNVSLTGTCTDQAGNTSGDATVVFDYDATAPGITFVSRTPAANGFGWNSGPVTAEWACSDGVSGVVSLSASDTVNGPGLALSVSGTCADLAGNTASDTHGGINIDTVAPHAPTLSADRTPDYVSGGMAWYGGSVTVSSSHNGDDGAVQSGVDPASVADPVTKSISGSHVVSDLVADEAGNESASASLTVWVDATAPVVVATCPASPLILGSTASAGWTASDAHAGLATAASGSVALDTASVGSKTSTVPAGTATDNVGNPSAAATCDYRVEFGYRGFLQPINDTAHQTGVNQSKFKLGSTVPAKFKLFDASGATVQQTGVPEFSRRMLGTACDSGTTLESATSASVTSGSDYKWSATDRHYQFNVSTKGWAAGEWRIYISNLDDGRTYYTDLCLAR